MKGQFTLDLSANRLKSLDSNIFSYARNLVDISLGGNSFSVLPDRLFAKNYQLKHFRMLDNHAIMKTLPEYFLANQSSLRTVGAIKCNLLKIPENIFFGSESILTISLHGNALLVLPKNLLKDQKNLRELDLSENGITYFNEDFFLETKQLKVLNLSRNSLTYISA